MRAKFFALAAFILICTSVFGGKLKQSDVELTSKLVGTWGLSPTDTRAKKLSGEITYKSNLTYEGVIVIKLQDSTTRWEFAGNWKIENHLLTETTTKSSVPDISSVGHISTVQIDFISDKELVEIKAEGRRESLIRK
jgi:hypothetical protein